MNGSLLDLLRLTGSILLCLILLQAAWHKLADYPRFLGFLADYRLLPHSLEKPAAVALLLCELAFAGLLLHPASHALGALGGAFLLLLYALAIAINLKRGRHHIECGCGGTTQPLSASLILRNLLLGGLALFVAGDYRSVMGGGGLIASMATACLFWLLYNTHQQLQANRGYMLRNQRA